MLSLSHYNLYFKYLLILLHCFKYACIFVTIHVSFTNSKLISSICSNALVEYFLLSNFSLSFWSPSANFWIMKIQSLLTCNYSITSISVLFSSKQLILEYGAFIFYSDNTLFLWELFFVWKSLNSCPAN